MSETKDVTRKPAAPAAPPPAAPQAAAPPPAPAPVEPVYKPPLALPRIDLAHAADGPMGNIWKARPVKGTPWQDVLQDWYWANRAKDMKPGDMIHVIEETMAYSGWLLVRQTRVVGPGNVPNRVSVVAELFKQYDLLQDEPHFDGLFPHWEGIHKKWCIMERGKIDPVKEGYASKDDAMRDLRNLAAMRSEPRRPDMWHG